MGEWKPYVGFVVGVALGFAARDFLQRSSPSGPGREAKEMVLSKQAVAAVEAQAAESRRAVERAEARVAELEKKLAAAGKVAAAPAPAPAPAPPVERAAAAPAAPDRAARLAKMGGEIDAALLAKDGKQALALLRELTKLGKEGWPEAAKLIMAIQKSIEEGNTLGIVANDFYKTACSGDLALLHADAMQNPGEYSAEFRKFAAGSLPWTDLENVNDMLLKQLPREEDAAVARAIAAELAGRPDAQNVPGLLSALEAQQNAQARLAIARALAGIPGDAATQALEAVAATERDPDVKRAAESALQGRRAQVAGFLITFVAPDSQAQAIGVHEGDILVTYKGMQVTSMEMLDQAKATVQADEVVELGLARGGRTVVVHAKGGQIGINGRFVKPER